MNDTSRPGPRTRTELFLAFNWMALQGFGGVLAVVQRELVERKQWLTLEEFVEDWSVSQILPGPNVVNLGLIMGNRYFGLSGGLVAMAGLLLVPLVIVLVLAVLYGQFEHLPAIQAALRGMGAVVAGLIIATGMKLIPALRKNPIGRTWAWPGSSLGSSWWPWSACRWRYRCSPWAAPLACGHGCNCVVRRKPHEHHRLVEPHLAFRGAVDAGGGRRDCHRA